MRTAALAALLSGAILTATGYEAGALQTETVRLSIRLLIGPIPAVFFLAGILSMSCYPITRERHEEILCGLDEARR